MLAWSLLTSRATLSDLFVSSSRLNVTLHPQSFVTDYTTQPYFSDKPESLFPDAQVDMALTCLRYLSFNNFGMGLLPWTLWDSSPFLHYAALHWGIHTHGKAEESCEEVVIGFLQKSLNVACAMDILSREPTFWRGMWAPLSNQPSQVTVMHLLAFFGLERSMCDLLEKGVCADLKDVQGCTPLTLAAENGHTDVVSILVA